VHSQPGCPEGSFSLYNTTLSRGKAGGDEGVLLDPKAQACSPITTM
jgi:hypothetical protein